jgi:catechol 2,3-dioxygenase-like lactoylglutathione lyase family enzyme
VALEVEDLDGWRARFAAEGMAVEDGQPLPGLRRVFVRDPAGNRLEIYETVL